MPRRRSPPPLVAILFLGACGAPSAEPAPAPTEDPCSLAADEAGAAPGSVVALALDAPVDPAHAPRPTNHAERLVFRQLYQTLVSVDCTGEVRPGLARSWMAQDDGRVWTFTLGAATFWDGEALGAHHVAAGWSEANLAAFGVLPDSLTVVDRATLRVVLDRPIPAPYSFADPELAVSRSARGAPWPVGSGPYRPLDHGADLRLHAVRGDRAITVRTVSRSAARDALDGDVHFLVTDDPDAVGYATGRADLAAVPLPWDRTYVLASAPAAPPMETADEDAAFRAALAADAVRADAQGAVPPFWWERLPGRCVAPSPTVAPPLAGRVLYERRDETARGLAARIVALAPLDRGLRAEALAAPAFDAALRAGGDLYVLSVPRRVFEACAAARHLVARAPWLAGTFTPGPTPSLTPLIDVRRHALARRMPAGAVIEWDGTIRFADR